jgi:cell filamentation protein
MKRKKLFDTQYCYPNSNVLINKFGITDNEQLHEIERQITMVRYAQNEIAPIPGKFDVKHILSIHKHLFKDIYNWAGKFRTVNIAKGNLFCLVQHVETYLTDTLDKLSKENLLVGTPIEKLPDKLGQYFGDINAAHPFREGNGRTQRLLFEMLGKVNGADIDFNKTTETEMLEASVTSFDGDNTGIVALFQKVISPISKEEQINYAKKILPANHKALRLTGV